MSWSGLFDLIEKYFYQLVILGFLIPLITYFIVKPFIKYQNLREELSKTLYENAPIVFNIGFSQEEYKEAYNELRRMGGEITGFINSTKIEWFMRLLQIPKKNDMNDAIGRINRVTNFLNNGSMITQIYEDYQRIKEIFKIE